MICTSCGEELEEQEMEGPEHDEDGSILCDDCYYDEYCFKCCICEEYANNKEKQVVIIFDKTLGIKQGIYRILEWPFYYQSIIGDDTRIFPDAVERLGDVPKNINSDGYSGGYLCAECQKKVTP